jgi:hypothetical protein
LTGAQYFTLGNRGYGRKMVKKIERGGLSITDFMGTAYQINSCAGKASNTTVYI